MDANQSTTHSQHEKKHAPPPVHINNVQLPQKEGVKYIGLHLDRRLTWHKHIFVKRKQLGITLIKMCWLPSQNSLQTPNFSYTKQY
jgi:hypothetical protein